LGLGENYVVSVSDQGIPQSRNSQVAEGEEPTIVEYLDRFALGHKSHSPTSSDESHGSPISPKSIDHGVLIAERTYNNRGKSNTVVFQKTQEPVSTAVAPPVIRTDVLHWEATITSWSACADHEQNWENKRGEAMAKPMIDYLYTNSHPTYRTLLLELTRVMHKNGLQRKKSWETSGKTDPVVFQRPQLGSLGKLDLDLELTL